LPQTEGLNHSQVIAEKTIKLLTEQKIRHIPQNFTIWYEYLNESNPDLVRAINNLLAQKEKFSEKFAKEIYCKYFTHEDEGKAIRKTNRLVQKSMDKVILNLNSTTQDFTGYSEKLSDFATKAERLSVSELQNVVGEIVEQTNTMTENAKNLNESLDSASNEISSLRKLLREVQQEALTDTLTGIANRKSFDENLQNAIAHAGDTGQNLCLLFTDIDYFKKFNDLHGHPFGDQVLKLVAHTLSKKVSRVATVARYGGEEFTIILPNTSVQDAVNIANDLRISVSAKKLVKKSTGEDVGKITMSFGVTQYMPREDAENFIERADEALYMAKNAGRNTVKHIEGALATTG
jgi:diguanylate cyclase